MKMRLCSICVYMGDAFIGNGKLAIKNAPEIANRDKKLLFLLLRLGTQVSVLCSPGSKYHHKQTK